MTGPARIVLVGGGLAAAKTAQALRKRGYDGTLTLLTAEAHRPYERPPLSKGYLSGDTPAEEVFVHEAGWYAEHDVDLRTSTDVVALDRERREVRAASGERFEYDAVLLATGASPRRPPIPGAYADGVLALRTIDDSDALRARLARGEPVVVVGGGGGRPRPEPRARRPPCRLRGHRGRGRLTTPAARARYARRLGLHGPAPRSRGAVRARRLRRGPSGRRVRRRRRRPARRRHGAARRHRPGRRRGDARRRARAGGGPADRERHRRRLGPAQQRS